MLRIGDFAIVPALKVKDAPHSRRLATLMEARTFVDDALGLKRTAPWRAIQRRLAGVGSDEEAAGAIGALRELLMLEGLLVPSTGG